MINWFKDIINNVWHFLLIIYNFVCEFIEIIIPAPYSGYIVIIFTICSVIWLVWKILKIVKLL